MERVLDRPPAGLPLLLRAALPAVPGVSALPGVRRSGSALPDLVVTRRAVAVDRSHVEAYARVCGFPRKDALPLTYLHVPAFPLHLTVLTDRSFPFPAVGLVHLENVVTQHRPTTAGERYDLTVSVERLRPHPKGRAFDLRTDVSVDGEVVWEEVSTYLRRGGGSAEPGPREPAPPVVGGPGVEWRLGGDLGRRYAAVSGDRNPIHLYAVTARPFGFRRQIAHGMWSMARCVAAVENRLPDAVRVEAAFQRPVVLPATVRFTARRAGSDLAFSLVDPRSGAPHVAGRVEPAVSGASRTRGS